MPESIFTTDTPLKIQDNTLRDGHQSLLATRMRLEDMLPIAEGLDEIGFWACEVWGGATFDSMTRFLNEDPWERVRTLKKYIKKTPFSMLLRGQNLVGYRNYADDVVRAFVDKACEVGIDVFRTFDALNDLRNFEVCVERILANGKHFQGCICYSLTQRRMGGPVFNLDYYKAKAKTIEEMGAHSLCIKDMAGLIAPYDVFRLVSELKKTVNIPIHLHTHYTSGMASMTYLKAAEAGVDIVDCCLAPFALRTSQPAVEPIVAALEDTPRDPGLPLEKLIELGHHLEDIAPKYKDYLATNKMSVIDTGVLVHQIPGGMISNLVSQLKENKALHRLDEVYAEVPITRQELGTPPLVTPTSQIVGVQAVLNVLVGKYKVVTNQVKDLVYGLYGKTPTEVPEDIRRKVLKGYKHGQTPITTRPGDNIPPELDEARALAEKEGVARTEEDVLTTAIYPITGLQFLKWKYGLAEPPAEVLPLSLEQAQKEQEACDATCLE
ncbi:MAG: pyruvate carboxylase subunit B, partial [Deltaproteobacteria bacterium]|nr:pyruvate carboxylase subunit B [Deltaproteobacteria bacterium]